MDRRRFARLIRALIRLLGGRIAHLEKATGIPRARIREWLQQRRREMSLATCAKLAVVIEAPRMVATARACLQRPANMRRHVSAGPRVVDGFDDIRPEAERRRKKGLPAPHIDGVRRLKVADLQALRDYGWVGKELPDASDQVIAVTSDLTLWEFLELSDDDKKRWEVSVGMSAGEYWRDVANKLFRAWHLRALQICG